MHILLHENEFYLQVNENSFEYEWLSTKTRFEKEEQDNLEIETRTEETKFTKQTEGRI